MNWLFTNDRPIWLQLTEKLTVRLVSGFYAPGGRLPSVRELAAEAGVNPNTMQRALAELERDGLLVSNRTAGRTVTDDPAKVQAVRTNLALRRVSGFLSDMRALGFTDEDSLALAEQQLRAAKRKEGS